MGYKREQWHSGLTYEQTCEECKTTVRYTDHKLDFRPWYADGFIYCPKCKTPLRHNEKYAIDAPEEVVVDMTKKIPTTISSNNNLGLAKFCSSCGAQFAENARFCSNCGAKRQ